MRKLCCACLETVQEHLVIEPAMDMDVSEMEAPRGAVRLSALGVKCYKVWLTFRTLGLAERGAAAFDGKRCITGCDGADFPVLGVHPNWQQEWCACGGRRFKGHRCDWVAMRIERHDEDLGGDAFACWVVERYRSSAGSGAPRIMVGLATGWLFFFNKTICISS